MGLARRFRFALALALLSCARAEPQQSASAPVRQVAPASAPDVPSPSVAASAAEAPAPEPRRLEGAPLVELDVAGFRPATLVVPVGARGPRPVAIALHGNFDRPEWQCGVWQSIVRNAFVLCPRGVPRRDAPAAWDRWEYGSAKAMKNEIEAALAALRDRFGAFVDQGPLMFIGFSLGAIYGAPLVHAEPARFARVVFIEGGISAWTPYTAKKFVQAGGQRLILACGQPDCLGKVKRLGPSLERAGLPTRVGGSAKAGHSYDGDVARVVAENWAWFTEGDPRWSIE